MSLAPYYPALVIMAGAVIVAFGGFWAAYRQANFNARLNDKNNEIIALQGQQIQSITGGNAFPIIDASFLMGQDTLLLMLPTEGKYTIYDLQVSLIDQDLFSTMVATSKDLHNEIAEIQKKATTFFPIGNIGPNQGRELARFALDPKTVKRNFFITMLARNGPVTEDIRIRRVNDKWVLAYRAYNQKGTLEQRVSPDFPPDQIWTN